jgi:HK97 family phage major capsid protein
MKTIAELRDERSNLKNELDGILSSAESEKRELKDAEESRCDEIVAEIKSLDGKILKADERKNARVKEATDARRTERKRGEEREKANIAKQYSFSRALRSQLTGKQLDGVEAEVQREAELEARSSGLNVEGTAVPSFMIDLQKRDFTVGGNSGANGANTVSTDVGDLVPALRPRLQVQALGANVLTGLTGNLSIPKQDDLLNAVWEGEQDAAAETVAAISKLDLTPNRLAAFSNVSRQLILQSNESVEAFIRSELESAISRAGDAAFINGTGSGQPQGILGGASADTLVALGANGAVPTRDALVDMIGKIDEANADVDNMSFLMTPGMRSKLMKTKTDAGSGMFVIEDRDSVLGYNLAVSTQVPSNLTKGSASAICHAIIFGNFRDYIIANWGGVDIIVDPYTLAKQATVQLVVNSFWDGGLRRDKSFATIVDALTA